MGLFTDRTLGSTIFGKMLQKVQKIFQKIKVKSHFPTMPRGKYHSYLKRVCSKNLEQILYDFKGILATKIDIKRLSKGRNVSNWGQNVKILG